MDKTITSPWRVVALTQSETQVVAEISNRLYKLMHEYVVISDQIDAAKAALNEKRQMLAKKYGLVQDCTTNLSDDCEYLIGYPKAVHKSEQVSWPVIGPDKFET